VSSAEVAKMWSKCDVFCASNLGRAPNLLIFVGGGEGICKSTPLPTY